MDSDGMCTVVACRDGSLRLLSSPLSKGFVQASTDESIPLRVARNVCRAPSLSLCPVAAIALVSRLALPPSLVRVHQLLNELPIVGSRAFRFFPRGNARPGLQSLRTWALDGDLVVCCCSVDVPQATTAVAVNHPA